MNLLPKQTKTFKYIVTIGLASHGGQGGRFISRELIVKSVNTRARLSVLVKECLLKVSPREQESEQREAFLHF